MGLSLPGHKASILGNDIKYIVYVVPKRHLAQSSGFLLQVRAYFCADFISCFVLRAIGDPGTTDENNDGRWFKYLPLISNVGSSSKISYT